MATYNSPTELWQQRVNQGLQADPAWHTPAPAPAPQNYFWQAPQEAAPASPVVAPQPAQPDTRPEVGTDYLNSFNNRLSGGAPGGQFDQLAKVNGLSWDGNGWNKIGADDGQYHGPEPTSMADFKSVAGDESQLRNYMTSAMGSVYLPNVISALQQQNPDWWKMENSDLTSLARDIQGGFTKYKNPTELWQTQVNEGTRADTFGGDAGYAEYMKGASAPTLGLSSAAIQDYINAYGKVQGTDAFSKQAYGDTGGMYFGGTQALGESAKLLAQYLKDPSSLNLSSTDMSALLQPLMWNQLGNSTVWQAGSKNAPALMQELNDIFGTNLSMGAQNNALSVTDPRKQLASYLLDKNNIKNINMGALGQWYQKKVAESNAYDQQYYANLPGALQKLTDNRAAMQQLKNDSLAAQTATLNAMNKSMNQNSALSYFTPTTATTWG